MDILLAIVVWLAGLAFGIALLVALLRILFTHTKNQRQMIDLLTQARDALGRINRVAQDLAEKNREARVFCARCEKPSPEGAKWCVHCGNALAATS